MEAGGECVRCYPFARYILGFDAYYCWYAGSQWSTSRKGLLFLKIFI